MYCIYNGNANTFHTTSDTDSDTVAPPENARIVAPPHCTWRCFMTDPMHKKIKQKNEHLLEAAVMHEYLNSNLRYLYVVGMVVSIGMQAWLLSCEHSGYKSII